jgi:serine/threonine-protein kinase HipA
MKNYKHKNPLYTTVPKSAVQERGARYFPTTRKCLYCYKKLEANDEWLYHLACSKKFFGQSYMPSLAYTTEQLYELAKQYVEANMSVTGVQPKVSLSWYRKEKNNPVKKLTIMGMYGDFILKPQSNYYRALPELEDCTMKMADVCGLSTVPHTLFSLQDNSLCYLTKRIDRVKNQMRHMEDMCQLSERLTEDKYKGSHEQVAKLVAKYSSAPGFDLTNYYEFVLFCFFTGNADMHLKNFSLLETSTRGQMVLSPAYDLVSTALVNKEDKEELALTLNGKKSKLQYKDFAVAFENAGLSKKVLDTTLDNFFHCKYEMVEVMMNSFLPEDMKEEYERLLYARMQRLQ